jgi:hypothetical protein
MTVLSVQPLGCYNTLSPRKQQAPLARDKEVLTAAEFSPVVGRETSPAAFQRRKIADAEPSSGHTSRRNMSSRREPRLD